MKHYAGIGSRSTPEKMQGFMSCLAAMLCEKEYILRSGGAEGADLAFERGCNLVDNNRKEIFLIGKSRRDKDDLTGVIVGKGSKYQEAKEIAGNIHPAWDRCSDVAKSLHTRNVFQILGLSLEDPVEFVVCWTPKGEDVGGTRTAIVLARNNDIPVYNLAKKDEIVKLIGRL